MKTMDDCEILTATEASRAFSDVLHRVCYGGESFIIKKGSRMMARITPVPVSETAAEAIPQAEETSSTPEIPAEPVVTTADEAEFYQAWMEQVRKVDA